MQTEEKDLTTSHFISARKTINHSPSQLNPSIVFT